MHVILVWHLLLLLMHKLLPVATSVTTVADNGFISLKAVDMFLDGTL